MRPGIVVRKRSERGFSLIMIGCCAVVMFGMLGLTTDLGRVFIVKNELQAFVDAASVAGALKLDGTSAGLTNAAATGTTGPVGPSGTVNSWMLSTQVVASPTVTCAKTISSAYSACPSAPVDSRFVQVAATANVPMYFIPLVPGAASTIAVNTVATAGLKVKNTITAGGAGAAPFSPDAHDPSDPNFGFTKGMHYTMKWKGDPSPCDGDAGFVNTKGASDRGYVDIGQPNGESGIVDALVNNIEFSKTLKKGDTLDWVTGNKNLGKGLDPRINQDTDPYVPLTYAEYLSRGLGNGRRLLIVPVNDPTLNTSSKAVIAGFALFFMNDFTQKNSDPYCAEYVGTAKPGDTTPGVGHTNPDEYYAVQLLR